MGYMALGITSRLRLYTSTAVSTCPAGETTNYGYTVLAAVHTSSGQLLASSIISDLGTENVDLLAVQDIIWSKAAKLEAPPTKGRR